MFLIVGTSFASFSFPVAESSYRIGLSVVLLLTTVIFKFSVSSYLLKSGTLTLMDKYIIFSFLFLTALFIENVSVKILANNDIENPAIHWLDVAAECVFIPVWCLVHVVIACFSRCLFVQPWQKVEHTQIFGDRYSVSRTSSQKFYLN
eukprot:TRINITY_DN5345_c0_g1_i1.p1 TRINITY_DN5345_c0_g1~~TRINITY_DN5345_c0_g1_i1.p1  ORF type:complete len:148 (-),score=7.06 TRINITY_DN5345_c0_g1_i1:64-507(-)